MSIPDTYDTNSKILRPNLRKVRQVPNYNFTDWLNTHLIFKVILYAECQGAKLRYLSLRLPKVTAPNITPTKKIVAVALFFPLLSHTRSHLYKHIKKETWWHELLLPKMWSWWWTSELYLSDFLQVTKREGHLWGQSRLEGGVIVHPSILARHCA